MTTQFHPHQWTHGMNGFKLLITYNPLTHREMEYRRFMIQRWLPGMQELGLQPVDVMHTLWGSYPIRLIVLYAPDLDTMEEAMGGQAWQEWHEQLHTFVRNLRYRVVAARTWLQF